MAKWCDKIKCLRCGIQIYGASGMDPDVPKHNELCICFACGYMQAFNASCYNEVTLVELSTQDRIDAKSTLTEYQRGVIDTLDFWWEDKQSNRELATKKSREEPFEPTA